MSEFEKWWTETYEEVWMRSQSYQGLPETTARNAWNAALDAAKRKMPKVDENTTEDEMFALGPEGAAWLRRAFQAVDALKEPR